ncbi:hypothetical protein ACFU5O_33810 [Streptomyces sp. NPDC057445]|uniref:hypothetical protein n=1 Tax=Streptomyces sp. NPDC057445 TaxID=3346136 RepID=UPI00367942B7
MGEQRPEMYQKRHGKGRAAAQQEAQQQERRPDLSVPQVAGSALAAVAAAVLASRLGVYGTVVGAGVVSIVATCGGPVFQHLFRRTGEQIRDATVHARPRTRQSAHRPPNEVCPEGEFGTSTTHGTRIRGWKRSVAAAAAVFAVAMLGVTTYEIASGKDLGGGTGTTVGSVVRGGGGGSGEDSAPGGTSPDGTPDGTSDAPRQKGNPDEGGRGGDGNAGPGNGSRDGQSPDPSPRGGGPDGDGSRGDGASGSVPAPDASTPAGESPQPPAPSGPPPPSSSAETDAGAS